MYQLIYFRITLYTVNKYYIFLHQMYKLLQHDEHLSDQIFQDKIFSSLTNTTFYLVQM